MKSMLIALLLANAAFATTYDFFLANTNLNTVSEKSYELEKNISIDIKEILGDRVSIEVNGVESVYTLVNYFSKSYVNLKTDTIEDSMCDERETVSYQLTFSQKRTGEYISIKDVSLKAVHEYTNDWCHSTPESTDIEYLLK